MKKTIFIFSLCAAGELLFAGCSKSKSAATPGSGGGGGQVTADSNGTAAQSAPVDMEVKWVDGKKYMMEMDLDQNTTVNTPSQPIAQELKYTQDFHISPVKKLDNGGDELELEFDSQMFDMTRNGQEVLNFDSTKNTPPPAGNPMVAALARTMKAMIGVPLDYYTDGDGNVDKIEGTDTLQSHIGAVATPQQQANFKQLFSEDTLKQYGEFSESLPKHPVNIGDSWPVTRDMTSAVGVITVNVTCTFQDWEQHDGHKCMHILDTGDIKTKSSSAAMTGAVVEIQKGTLNGEVWFDPDLGMFVDVINNQDMTMKITTRAQTFTQELKQQIQVTLLDVTP